MATFVDQDSIVRKIWGKADTILFIFAGSAAEFALNKAVDWLYFTGRIPNDPLGRLFSTVAYARQIIFSDMESAHRSIDQINAIHKGVEQARGGQIPDWAYRDVLFMLIDMSIRSFELLERKLTLKEKIEIVDVFIRVGQRMQLKGLPKGYMEWEIMREQHLNDDLISSDFTIDLYKQYRKHLGPVRYLLLKQVQLMVSPKKVKSMLRIGKIPYLLPLLYGYKIFRAIRFERIFRDALLPLQYKAQIIALDTGSRCPFHRRAYQSKFIRPKP